ncbi:hypothetical protein V7O66_13980 [Methanolobus sp. ZRKC3]|uniref:hypothetical protein n=1 Tax=Methanolobus sp. ZRKC3 TaxID=3125786 RepID=UPI003253C4A1
MSMETDVKKPIRVEFKQEKSEDHISFVSNRVWGGLQAGGLFEMNFLLEKKPLPNRITVEMSPDVPDKEISRSQSKEVMRINQATAYMTLEAFVSLHDWMGQKIAELEKAEVIGRDKRALGSEADE